MKVLDFGQCTYALFVYIQMVFFYFWIHILGKNSIERIQGGIKIKVRYFEWGIYFIYLLVSYYFVDSIEKYIGVQIVFLCSVFYWKREKFFTRKTFFILFCLCVPEFIISSFKIGVTNTMQRYGPYKNLQQLFLVGVVQIILLIVVAVGYREKWIENGFEKTGRINRVEEGKGLEITIFFVLPFLSFFLLYLLKGKVDKKIFYFVFISLIFINLILFYIIKLYFRKGKLEERWEVIERQNLFYQKQFDRVHSSSKRIDMLWHDLKHHLFILDRLIKNKAWVDATQYIEKLIGQEEGIEDLENTGNLVIDSIVNYKRKIALENGILFEARIEIPDGLVFDDFDITVLLGNLLDNALYAAKGTKSAFLFISIKYSKKRLIIVVKNSVYGKEKRILKKSQLKKSQYGIGLQNVRQIVVKYHGDLETGYSYGEFYAKAILFLEI